MYSLAFKNLEKISKSGQAHTLGERQIGVEKECLRVNQSGGISQRVHPRVLGSALTHPSITTDYSEALLEIVTPPFRDIRETLNYLCDTQRNIYSQLEDQELLWATSMPCVISGNASVPIARYGESNQGLMKSIYRDGLGLRYGKTMQVIAGVHFNFSFSAGFWELYQGLLDNHEDLQSFIDEQYFHLIRNLLRFGWLIPYLFGASPAVCKTFLGDNPRPPNMEVFNETTYYERYGTSLRMGDIGYQNKKEGDYGVSADYSNVKAYTASLHKALTTPHEAYARLGLKKNGKYQQLNTNLLQIENEYYSSVRPKQIPEKEEMPILALLRRGVRYIELRSLDVNAYDPLGINEEQVRFVEVLMLFCLCQESPQISKTEARHIDFNLSIVAHRGREPGLSLHSCERHEVRVKDFGEELVSGMIEFAKLLDEVHGKDLYQKAVISQKQKFSDPDLTPSSRMLDEMHENKEAFFQFALRKSEEHHKFFTEQKLSDIALDRFKLAANQSLQAQNDIEVNTQKPLDDYLSDYFEQLNAREFTAN